MAENYLTGGQQTTVNSTITELFPALCFNNGYNPKTPEDLENFINGVNLDSAKSKKTLEPFSCFAVSIAFPAINTPFL